ncbi:MAG: hypothetical protein A2076_03640 [Geobacteraceae bacterium GWC2_53_11]|nr:MAG: hypothetical protein A2076_03640 [Geobacteraceae bacterium GWC2_53_11]
MAAGAGVDLADRHTGGGDALGIVVGLLVPFDNGAAQRTGQVAQGALQQGRLAGAGGADQVEDKNPFVLEQGAVKGCQSVVLAQDVLFDGNGFPRNLVGPVLVGVAMTVVVSVGVMVVIMAMIVVMICRGTAAGCAHGKLHKRRYEQGNSFAMQNQYRLKSKTAGLPQRLRDTEENTRTFGLAS